MNNGMNEIISKLPPWSFPAILVGAVFSGVVGSRSTLFSQIFQHIFAIVILVARALRRAGSLGTTIPANVVSEVVEEFVEIPVEKSSLKSSTKSIKSVVSNNKRTSSSLSSGNALESCRHVHEIQLSCDSDGTPV